MSKPVMCEKCGGRQDSALHKVRCVLAVARCGAYAESGPGDFFLGAESSKRERREDWSWQQLIDNRE